MPSSRFVALGIVAFTLAGTALAIRAVRRPAERRLASLLGAELSRQTASGVRVGNLRLSGGRLEARNVRIDGEDPGPSLALEEVVATPNWARSLLERRLALREVAVRGVRVRLDERVLRRKALRTAPSGDRRSGVVASPALLTIAEVVTFERVSLYSRERKEELVALRGRLSSARDGGTSRFQLWAATEGEGTIEGEGRLDRAGRVTGSIRFGDLSMKPLLALAPEVRWHRPAEARVDGELLFSREGQRLSVSGDLLLRELAIEWEPVAAAPVAADARLEVEAHWENGSLMVPRGRLGLGGAEIEWDGVLRLNREGELSAELRLTLRETRCQEVLDAIPEAMLGEYSGFVLDGTMSGSARLRRRAGKPGDTRLEIEVDDACRFRQAPPRAAIERLRRPFVHRVSIGEGRTLSFATGPSSPNWTSLSRVSPFLLHAVLAQEDGTFFSHRGFSPEAFGMALERNLQERRFASGASTISMQVARNLFLDREKTLARKLQEIVLTWWLEKRLTKDEILELYLNVIEFGPSVYGVGAASRHYFGRQPDSLSAAEAAFLASVLPAPSRYHRAYERGELSASGRNRVGRVLRLMAARGFIDEAALAHELREVRRGLRFRYGPGPAPDGEESGRAAPPSSASGSDSVVSRARTMNR